MRRLRLLFMLACFLPVIAHAAPRAELWDYWLPHDPGSGITVDHRAWDDFLGRYRRMDADGIARLAYGAVSGDDRAALAAYIAMLSDMPVRRLNRAEQLAFWLNLYNALTVQVVLQHHPVQSIREISISPGLFSRGPWGRKLLKIDGAEISLDDIEHRILRPVWRDPRLHYGLNCASLGCPDLPPRAFTAATVGTQLEVAARTFIRHPRAVRIEDGRLHVSSLYVWFREDFGDSDAAVIAHIAGYAEPRLRDQLYGIDRIAGHDYDWHLNDSGR